MQQPLPYSMPQGIDVGLRKHQAIPRKVGAYDTEGIAKGKVPNKLTFFSSATQFGQPLKIHAAKVYGRDTNITSKDGGMAKGERLYAYGITAKVSAGDQSLNSPDAAKVFDEWRRLWDVSHFTVKLGNDEFITVQARDIPAFAAGRPHIDGAKDFVLVCDVSSAGRMYDLTIQREPYMFDQQEDFKVEMEINPQTLDLSLETLVTFRFEGLRLKALRS